MILQTRMFSYSRRRKVKLLAVGIMGLIGLAVAVAAFLLTQEQVLLSQLNQEISQSPLGVVLTSIKALFDV